LVVQIPASPPASPVPELPLDPEPLPAPELPLDPELPAPELPPDPDPPLDPLDPDPPLAASLDPELPLDVKPPLDPEPLDPEPTPDVPSTAASVELDVLPPLEHAAADRAVHAASGAAARRIEFMPWAIRRDRRSSVLGLGERLTTSLPRARALVEGRGHSTRRIT
jgi:hypothetical protein